MYNVYIEEEKEIIEDSCCITYPLKTWQMQSHHLDFVLTLHNTPDIKQWLP